jgi:hypothetical protein
MGLGPEDAVVRNPLKEYWSKFGDPEGLHLECPPQHDDRLRAGLRFVRTSRVIGPDQTLSDSPNSTECAGLAVELHIDGLNEDSTHASSIRTQENGTW